MRKLYCRLQSSPQTSVLQTPNPSHLVRRSHRLAHLLVVELLRLLQQTEEARTYPRTISFCLLVHRFLNLPLVRHLIFRLILLLQRKTKRTGRSFIMNDEGLSPCPSVSSPLVGSPARRASPAPAADSGKSSSTNE